MAIDRSGFNAWVDDDGSGTVGTVLDKATMAEDILDPIDAAIAAPGAATPHHLTHEPGGSDPLAVDAAAATGSLRTLGTSATSAAAGNDARLTNARAPTAHRATHEPGGSDAITALSADVLTSGTLPVARLPAHHATHDTGGADAIAALSAAVLTSGTLPAARLPSPLTIAGGQIAFPATQVPSSDPNTLDDYREGLWTPTLTATGGASGQIYGVQTGVYTKVGRLVVASGRLAVTTIGTLSGNLQLAGFPVTSGSQTLWAVTVAIFDGLSLAVSVLGAYLPPGSTVASLRYVPAAGAIGMSNLPATAIANGFDVTFSCAYVANV